MDIHGLNSVEEPLGSRDHRAHQQPVADRNTLPGHTAPGVQPVDNGLLAITAARQDPTRHSTDQDDRTREAKRRRALARLAATFGLPDSAVIEVAVDDETNAVRFLVRDTQTGQLLRELPAQLVQAHLTALEQTLGGLCDRSL